MQTIGNNTWTPALDVNSALQPASLLQRLNGALERAMSLRNRFEAASERIFRPHPVEQGAADADAWSSDNFESVLDALNRQLAELGYIADRFEQGL